MHGPTKGVVRIPHLACGFRIRLTWAISQTLGSQPLEVGMHFALVLERTFMATKKNTHFSRFGGPSCALLAALLCLGLILTGIGCGSTVSKPAIDASHAVPQGWGPASHGADAEPNYQRLFDDEAIADMKVHRFDLVIEQSTHDETMSDLANLLGACGKGARRGPRGPRGPRDPDRPAGRTGPGGSGGPGPGGPGGPGPGPGPGSRAAADPVWVPITVRHDGLVWTHVGMRYKGNSSLRGAWSSCIKKLSFRLDFDQFEEQFPGVLDQRFFGFKKMTFSNGYKDASLIRDKLAGDIFRRAGIPAARGAFAAVYATIGTAKPVYLGLYSMVEDPSNRLLDSQFDDDDGNLYKPESRWGPDTTASTLEADFEKKTNKGEGDWGDVAAVLEALHSATRESDPPSWRSKLEQHLDVPRYVRWLAVNQAMVNWDTYGCMPHNYYLYADPSDATTAAPNGRFTWIPWDLNESLLVGGRCNFADAAGLVPGAEVIGSEWPLIRYVLDDEVYAAMYLEELAGAFEDGGALEPAWLRARIAGYHELIAPYVIGPEAHEIAGYSFLPGARAFRDASQALLDFAAARERLVTEVLKP